MKRTFLAAVALLLVAACNTAPAATQKPFTVSLSSGGYFVGPTGMTLYTFDNDNLGHSACEKDCLTNWPILSTPSTPDITVGPGLDLAEFTAITREGGSLQVTFKLIPLYYYAGDQQVGDTNGNNVGGVWHVATSVSTLPNPFPPTPAPPTPTPAATPAATAAVTPDPNATCDPAYDDCDKYTPKPTPAATPAATPAPTPAATPAATPVATPVAEVQINLSEDGMFLVDAAGMSLYTFDSDTEENVSTCVDDCALNWPPLLVPEGATIVPAEGVEGEFIAFARPDGTMQVSYNTMPLYLYSGDTEPGDTSGDGINDVWHLASAQPVVNPL